ncbi:unnamed protein product, partial [Owenia fusiformis]
EDHIVHVSKHKTTRTHHAAQIVMPNDMYSLVDTYIRVIRPVCDNELVFVSGRGAALGSFRLAEWLEEKQLGRLTINQFRKKLVTEAFAQAKSAKETNIMAKHMKHSENTQKTVYNLHSQGQNAVEAHRLIRSLTRSERVTAPSAT